MSRTFHTSDLVCRTLYYDTLEFGKVREVRELNKEVPVKNETEIVSQEIEGTSTIDSFNNSNGSYVEPTEGEIRILWDEEKRRCTDENLVPRFSFTNSRDDNLLLVDRRFSVGQRVRCNGLGGKVVKCERLVTVQVIGSEMLPMVIPDLKLDNIIPLTDLFYGVIVEFGGWVGQVTKVCRKVTYKSELSDYGLEFYTVEDDRRSCTSSKYVEQGDQIGFSYPYMTLSSDPYVGKRIRFRPSDLLNYAVLTSTGSVMQDEKQCIELAQNLTVCQSVEVIGITVSWMGRWASHLPSWENVPNPTIEGSYLHGVHPLYINPSMYLDRDGICNCLCRRGGPTPIREDGWKTKFLAGQSEFDETCDSEMDVPFTEIETTNTCLVQKLFSRHLYTIKWDTDDSHIDSSELMTYFGFELEPEGNRDHSLRFIPPLSCFCKRNNIGIGFAKNEYGVAVEKSSEVTIQIQWLRILADGNVELALNKLEECNILDVKKHPTYGDFCENRVVIASKMARELEKPLDLVIGTVLFVDRWELGKVNVYCAIEKRKKTIWPYQIELFKEFPGNELMRLKLKGCNMGTGNREK